MVNVAEYKSGIHGPLGARRQNQTPPHFGAAGARPLSPQPKRPLTLLSCLQNEAIRCTSPQHPRPYKEVCNALILCTNISDLCRNRTIDYAVKIRVNPDQKGVDLAVKHSMVSTRTSPNAP